MLDADANIHLIGKTDYEHFFRSSVDAMLIADIEGKILDFNNAYEELTGYTREELIQRNGGWDIIHPDNLADVMERIQSIHTGLSKIAGFHIRIITKSGALKYISYDASVDRQRGLIYAIGRDVTENFHNQKLLEESEERFKSIFQNSSFGILLVDYEGRIVEANNKLIDRLGYKRKEFLQLSIRDVIYRDDQEEAFKIFENLIDDKYEKTYSERRFKKKNGELTWSQISCNRVNFSNDEKLVMAVVEDIDSIKKNELALLESEERFRAVFESSPMGILLAKSPGIVVEANPAITEMLGYKRSDLLGKRVIDFTYQQDIQKEKKWIDKIYNTDLRNYTLEKRFLKKDGKPFWAKSVVSKILVYGNDVFTVAIIENIDRRKKTEQALEQRNKELTLINQELEHFAYVASHDLQEPLRTITSFIQILEKRYSNKLDKDGIQFMGFVVEGSKRMQTLIHDLLEYSRINRFNTAYEKVDLNEVFSTVNRVLKEKIESNDAIILSENLPVIYGSKLQLTQVFQNLIDNSIKFRGKKKPEMFISVKNAGDKWELVFKDNGIGISQEYFQRIFVIFQRLHTHEEYDGTGIGLAVCKKIIERHGGDIWVESSPGKGSIFHMTIAKNLMQPIT